MPAPLPYFVRETAKWLNRTQNRSTRQIAEALGVGANTVAEWLRQDGLARTRGAAVHDWHRQRRPDLDKRRERAYVMHEHEGSTYKQIGVLLDISETTAFNDVQAVKQWPPVRRPKRNGKSSTLEPTAMPNGFRF